ncbi:MAG: hypothetical protein WDN46_24790 [Methylocella sp.]
MSIGSFPFLTRDDALDVVAEFADKTIARHVLDNHQLSPGTFELLEVCADRAVSDPAFRSGSPRAGEVSGRDLPRLIDALLVVAVERANGAARYVWRLERDWAHHADGDPPRDHDGLVDLRHVEVSASL